MFVHKHNNHIFEFGNTQVFMLLRHAAKLTNWVGGVRYHCVQYIVCHSVACVYNQLEEKQMSFSHIARVWRAVFLNPSMSHTSQPSMVYVL